MNARVTELEARIGPIAEALGYALVRVRLTGAGKPVLQVMAERADGTMHVDDCARLSHAISEAFESDDPIEGEYVLEVSSPGIDRPLTRRRDYEAYCGHEAKIELRAPIDGRRRLRCVLKGLKGEDVLVSVVASGTSDPSDLTIPFVSIAEAKLLLTDALIENDLKRRKQAERAAEPR